MGVGMDVLLRGIPDTLVIGLGNKYLFEVFTHDFELLELLGGILKLWLAKT
jgi:hypothetical protein